MTSEEREELINKTAALARAIKDWEDCVNATRADVLTCYLKEMRTELGAIFVANVDGGEIPERK